MFKTICGRGILGAAMALAVGPVLAAAPMAKSQAPGFYRLTVGEFEVTALSDGTVDIPMEKILHGPAGEVDAAIRRNFVKTPVETSVNAFLVNTGSKLVLVDAGSGALLGPTLGNVVRNLKAAGYSPEQVDEVYITHLHPDHLGGLSSEGKAVFPNAIVRADTRDAAYWLDNAHLAAAPGDKKAYFEGAQSSLAPYKAAGRFKPFDKDGELAAGIRATATYGHTPGHTSYVVESRGQKLVLIGDLMHAGFVQFADPRVTIAFDSDEKAAASARQAAFATAAKEGYLIGAGHLPFPALGHLRRSGTGYEFISANYSIPR